MTSFERKVVGLLIDLSVKVAYPPVGGSTDDQRKYSFGHLGTHFDVMDKEFPLEFVKRKGLVFDVRGVTDRDIDVSDLETDKIEADTFIALHTGFLGGEGYGTPAYFADHPQLSNELIELLLERRVSIIGLDFAGARRGAEHAKVDWYCADRARS